MSLIRNKAAFTLMESLVVLGIVGLLMILTTRIEQTMTDSLVGDQFASLLQNQLALTQQYAIVSGQDSRLTIDPAQGQLVSNLPNQQPISIPKKVQVDGYTYVFASFTGAAKRYRQLAFQVGQNHYLLKMQFGKGVNWIEKTK